MKKIIIFDEIWQTFQTKYDKILKKGNNMEYNITTVEKAKETLIKIKNNWPGIQLENVDYSKFHFIFNEQNTLDSVIEF